MKLNRKIALLRNETLDEIEAAVEEFKESFARAVNPIYSNCVAQAQLTQQVKQKRTWSLQRKTVVTYQNTRQ